MIVMSLKKILPVILLAALLIWGIYDIKDKKNINNTIVENPSGNKEFTNDSLDFKIGIDAGNLAPDFELTTLDGKKLKLSDYKGKKVILNFWATWCPPCKAEVPDMVKFYSSYKDKDIVILGVNLTQSEKDQRSVRDFVNSYGITYPVPLDMESTVAEVYRVTAIPTSYIIDTNGIISEKVVGPMDFEAMKSMVARIK
jgi:peroxiredoxin